MRESGEPYSEGYTFQGLPEPEAQALTLTPERKKYFDALRQKVAYLVGEVALFLEGPALADSPGAMRMARGGNYKVQRINLQNSGKANGKEAMPTEQKRLRKRKRKKK